MRKIKFILTSLLLVALSSCYLQNPNTSSESTSSNNTTESSSSLNSSTSSSSSNKPSTSSSSLNSSTTSNDKIYGSVPEGVKVYSELEAIEYMKSSSYKQFEEMYVSGIIASSSHNNSNTM